MLDGGTQSVEDLKIKEEKEMSKDISTRKNQDCITMKERVEESPWTLMKSEEVGDGERDIMLCSDQHSRRIPEEILTGISESHFFETNYWCMTVGIEEHLDDVSMQVVKHRMDALGKKGKIRIRPLTKAYVHYYEAGHKITLGKDCVEEGLAESLVNSWESSYQQKDKLIRGSMGDKNFNIFEINELCISVGITCEEPCEVFPEVKEE